jgi:hypothetical protein
LAEIERRERVDGIPKPNLNPDFGRLRDALIQGIERAMREQCMDEDLKQGLYEAAVEAVYGTDFWTWRRRQPW